jgi:hypothetical protein
MMHANSAARHASDDIGASDLRPAPRLYGALSRSAKRIGRRLRTTDAYRFDDRRTGEPTLVCLMAGHRRDLMPHVLTAASAALRDHYVCLVSDGSYDTDLSEFSRQLGWSYIGTWTRDTALAQNLCYRLHPEAQTIVKIDPAMLVLPGSISRLLARFTELKTESVIEPGALSPFIPLDGICHRPLLEALDLLDAFESRFGPAKLAAETSPIEASYDVAKWIWEHTCPLSETAQKLAAMPERLLMPPIRFRAGLVVFQRSFWEDFGFFPVLRRRLMVGRSTECTDGDALGAAAITMSRPIVMTSHALAGRIAFAPQIGAMSALMGESPDVFTV